MKRIIPLLTCFLLIVGIIGLTAVPVGAVSYTTLGSYRIVNWYDIVDDIVVDGDTQSVTLRIPSDWYKSIFYHYETGSVSIYDTHSVEGYYFTSVTGADRLRIHGCPFGYISYTNSYANPMYYLSTDLLPDELTILFEVNLIVSDASSIISHDRTYLYYYTLSSNGSYSRTLVNSGTAEDMGDHWYRYIYSSQLYDLSSTEYFSFYYDTLLINMSLMDGYIDYNNSDVFLKFDLSDFMTSIGDRAETAAFRSEITSQLQQQGYTLDEIKALQQQTNEKLDGIQDSMDDANDKLDDIMNGYEPDIVEPDDSGVVGDLGQLEDDLMSDAKDNFSAVDGILTNINNMFVNRTLPFLAVAYIVDLFTVIPAFADLLQLSVALGIFATLLSVGTSFVRTRSEAGNKSSKKGGK